MSAASGPRFAHGLVIGKFYPPHAGHHRMVELAAARCARLTVVAMAAARESVPLADRVRWLRAAHAGTPNVTVTGIRCDVPTDLGDDTVWQAQVALMRAAAAAPTAAPAQATAWADPPVVPVDAVFSSESYGDELAARLGARHVCVDPDRTAVPVSATAVRADLAGHWDRLATATRAGLAVRVVVLGAESTGTTTVAEALAARYTARGRVWSRTACVPEYGREYTVLKWEAARRAAAAAGAPSPPVQSLVWDHDDFDAVAARQTVTEEAAAASGSPLLVCDTDAFATSVWERRYLGARARPPQPWATRLPPRGVYLLTDHTDVPFVQDGLRDGEHLRAAMTGWFVDALVRAGHSWVLLTGSLPRRLDLAVRVCDQLLADRHTFAAPLPEPPR